VVSVALIAVVMLSLRSMSRPCSRHTLRAMIHTFAALVTRVLGWFVYYFGGRAGMGLGQGIKIRVQALHRLRWKYI
jgi:hypothetical protein